MIFRRLLWNAIWIALVPMLATVANAVPSTVQPGGSAQQQAASQIGALTGNYSDPAEASGGYTIYVQDGKLILESTRTVPTELAPVSATVFNVPGFETTAVFSLDSSGRATSFIFSATPNVVYHRTGEPVQHSSTIMCEARR